MKNLKYLLVSIWLLTTAAYAQNVPFQVHLEAMSIQGLPGLQSFAWGQHNGNWLIFGGRLDGLHRRQPFASFDEAGRNTQITVVNPQNGKKWTAALSVLPLGIREQLSATNMEFYQDGNTLYLIGGYGYSSVAGNHVTYANLCAVNVPVVINAIIEGKDFNAGFRQISDQEFAVTGGYLNKIYDKYYLTGGQKFTGRYNPMGPTHGTGFTQEYTNAIRTFRLTDDGTSISVKHDTPVKDTKNLHRRDYNVVPQIMPDGDQGLTAFSGVFRDSIDLPYLNCVNIDSNAYQVNNNFSQYYNHYHCAHFPAYSPSKNEMHTIFFGGIAQYYEEAGSLIRDDNVPFVKTIARVTRESNGKMSEYKLPVEMPALLGSGSEFIPLENLPEYENHVLDLDRLPADTTLIGYIYGGIASNSKNIFFTNTGTESKASNLIFKVYLIKNSSSATHNLNLQSITSLQMIMSPNPANGDVTVHFNLQNPEPVTVLLYSENGILLEEHKINNTTPGDNRYTINNRFLSQPGKYIVKLQTKNRIYTQKLIIHP